MIRKDYIKLAQALASTRRQAQFACSDCAIEVWGETRMAIAETLAADNPRFSRERFYAATETEKE